MAKTISHDAAFGLLELNTNVLIGELYEKKEIRSAILYLSHAWFKLEHWKHRTVSEFLKHVELKLSGPEAIRLAKDRFHKDQRALLLGRRITEMVHNYPGQFENEMMCVQACAEIIAGFAAKMNAGECKLEILDLRHKGKPVGNWTLTAKREGAL